MAGREVIERAALIPKWELSLQKEARIHNAHSSTSIEGNKLTLLEVKALSEKKDVVSSAKDKQEVLNYLEALDAIPRYAGKKDISKKIFLEIHKTVTKGTLKNPKHSGAFRNQQVFVGRRIFDGTGFREIVEYMPPKTREVPKLVEQFLTWLNAPGSEEINPVILAGVAHYETARIHPFIDGNGRTARLLASLVVYKSGFDHRRFFALDDYYDEDRPSYYAALKTAQVNDNDLTQWLEYFTEGVLYSVNKVKETIENLGLTKALTEGEPRTLTPRQLEILRKIKDKGRVTNKDLRGMFKVSRQAIVKEIKKLIGLGVIELVGKGRGAYYKMTD